LGVLVGLGVTVGLGVLVGVCVIVAVALGLGVLVEVGCAADALHANETSINRDINNNTGLGDLGCIDPPLYKVESIIKATSSKNNLFLKGINYKRLATLLGIR
jgi:hypothetical protein